MQSWSAEAARAAEARAEQCRLRAIDLEGRHRIGPESLRRARVELERAVRRENRARLRLQLAQRRHVARLLYTGHYWDPPRLSSAGEWDVGTLRQRAQDVGLFDLFMAYFALGGDCSPFELDAFINAVAELPAGELTVLRQAVWELTELPS